MSTLYCAECKKPFDCIDIVSDFTHPNPRKNYAETPCCGASEVYLDEEDMTASVNSVFLVDFGRPSQEVLAICLDGN